MSFILNRIVPLAVLALLAGCSSLNPFASRPKNAPAPLANVTPSMAVRVIWSVNVGKAGNQGFRPALSDGRLFTANEGGELMSIDPSNGKIVWRIDTGSRLVSGVAADGGTVVVAGAEGAVLAFDAANGQKRWKFDASTEVLSAPAIGNGTVVLRSLDNRIVALDAGTGSRRWYLQRSTPSLSLQAAPGIIVADGLAFVGLPAGRLIALSALSGAPRWEVTIAEPRGATELERVSDVSGTPALIGRDICATAYQGRIACVDAGNGTLRWARELSTAVGPGVDQRYVFAADEKGNLQAFARDTGSNLWRNTSLAWRGLSAPVSFGRAVVVGDRLGYLHFLSREEGALLARLSTDGSAIISAPLIAGSHLIVQTQDGRLLAVASD